MISRMRWRVRTQETGVNGHPDGAMAFTRESAAWHSDRKPTPSSISACTSLPRDLGFRLNATTRDRPQRARNFGRAVPGNGVIARCLIHQVSRVLLNSELCIETPPAKRVAAAFAELAHAI